MFCKIMQKKRKCKIIKTIFIFFLLMKATIRLRKKRIRLRSTIEIHRAFTCKSCSCLAIPNKIALTDERINCFPSEIPLFNMKKVDAFFKERTHLQMKYNYSINIRRYLSKSSELSCPIFPKTSCRGHFHDPRCK